MFALDVVSGAANAGRRVGHPADGYADGYVTAESRHGNGSITGRVREARYGYEVQLPGGTWVGCRRSCSETLRVETVDYDAYPDSLVGRGTLANECGIFGCLELRYPQ
jgi:hypothetical protein